MMSLEKEALVIWKELHESLFRFVRSRVPSREIAQDIAQDVLLKVVRQLDSLKDVQRLQSWAFQIARNAVADYYRSRRPEQPAPDLEGERLEESAEDSCTQEVASWMPRFLEELPEDDRVLLVKVDLEEVPQAQLAEEMSLSYSTLKSRVQRARNRLKALLEACCRIDFDKRGNVVGYQSAQCDC